MRSAKGLFTPLLRHLGVRGVLDVGTATGRGLRELQEALPGAFICGIEPVAALIEQGRGTGALKTVSVVQGNGESMPFPDRSFDSVCEFATLHHVPRPDAVVRENAARGAPSGGN